MSRITALDPAQATGKTAGLFTAVRAAGASDAEIVEVVAHVALNTPTNYTNHVARTALDFPVAAPLPV